MNKENSMTTPNEITSPTEEMILAGMEESVAGRPSVDDDAYVLSIWNAMCAAAPVAQEPVAFMCTHHASGVVRFLSFKRMADAYSPSDWKITLLYAAPVAAQAQPSHLRDATEMMPQPLTYDGSKADAYVTGWNDCVAASRSEQPVSGADGLPVAVLRFERGTTGRENEMPRVVSCNWMPDGEYKVYLHSGEPSGNAGEFPPITRFNPLDGMGMNPHPNGLYVYYADHERALAAQAQAITPADAVYGLLAWLSGRDEVVTLSARHGAAIAADLAKAFCEANGLQQFSADYPANLKYPESSLAQPVNAADGLHAAIMEKVQEFASTWAIVDGRFDDGTAINRAEACKTQIGYMLRDALAARPQPSGNAGELPTNEELESLWGEHGGHPADFAAAVLERWGGWRPGALGYGGSIAAQAQPPVSESLPYEQALFELIDKIEPGLDTGDLLADATTASKALSVRQASDPRTPSDMLVNGGALKMALNVLRRAGKTEVADELERTAQQASGQDIQNIEAAAITLADAFSYPWEHMPEQGRENMRKTASAVIDAARSVVKEKS